MRDEIIGFVAQTCEHCGDIYNGYKPQGHFCNTIEGINKNFKNKENQMVDLSKHPILKQCSELTEAIEECGASEKLTSAVIKSSDLLISLNKLVTTPSSNCPTNGFGANDYVWKTIEEYEDILGHKVNEAVKIGWTMARTTNQTIANLQNG